MLAKLVLHTAFLFAMGVPVALMYAAIRGIRP